MQVVFRSALFLVITAAIAIGLCPSVRAADVAIYEFTGNSPNSTDADAATTASAWTQTVGSITGDQVRADGSQVEGSFASSITANEYGGFTFNTNGNARDLSRLSLDYNAENPFGFSLGVFASTDGGATGFAAGNQLFTVNLADSAITTPATVVTSSNFFDLGNIASLQGLNGPVEFRFYLLDNSSLATRVSIIDNVRLSALASTVNDPRWNVNASGAYNTAGSWAPAAVPGAGASVVFGDVITADRTVTLGSNVNASRIAFSGNNGAYTIARPPVRRLASRAAAKSELRELSSTQSPPR